jgi:integrase
MSIQKLPNGRWRAGVGSGKDRKTKVFDKKSLALDWEAAEKAAKKAPPVEVKAEETKTVRFLIDKYIDEVTPGKEGSREETLRLRKFLRAFPDIADLTIDKLETAHLTAWRDARLCKVATGSVKREWTTIRAALRHALNVWKWPMPRNPLAGFKSPKDSPEREEVWSWRDIRAYFRAAGYRPGCKLESTRLQAAFAFHLTLRTALRSSEILQLGSASIDWHRKIAVIQNHKTRHRTGKPKKVPLFRRALRLLEPYRDDVLIFSISDQTRDTQFREARDEVPRIQHLHFHDGRATCLTHLSRRMPVEVLQKVSDHEDLNTLVNRYYRVTPEQIAERYAC